MFTKVAFVIGMALDSVIVLVCAHALLHFFRTGDIVLNGRLIRWRRHPLLAVTLALVHVVIGCYFGYAMFDVIRDPSRRR